MTTRQETHEPATEATMHDNADELANSNNQRAAAMQAGWLLGAFTSWSPRSCLQLAAFWGRMQR